MSTAPRARQADLLTGCAVAAILIIGAGVVLWGFSDRIAQLEAAARDRAPVAVIDYAPVLEGLAAGAPREALEAAFAGVKAEAEARVAQGYVVINASFVEGAPERFRISVPDMAARDLRAAVSAAQALAARGLPFAPTAPGGSASSEISPSLAAGGLGAAMTPEEARALIGAVGGRIAP